MSIKGYSVAQAYVDELQELTNYEQRKREQRERKNMLKERKLDRRSKREAKRNAWV
ncbi:hypothetical protein Abp1_0012 [Acinetobacter phage Abp1]|uniref:Uncharacterized protein n=1 Tax=Acinetobacter phage Abp1 TaxID=1235824 RepID=R4IPX9_9CAUD|nr:hypothetical protein M172_gp12 [Acinetobacter phage Abp1]AFV50987.1 hypothetical protein Abp1_0012 [Acinetobacter phage Abp1]